MRDIAFLLIWLVLAPLAIRYAFVGVMLWIWTALLAPNEMLYGAAAGIPFNKVAAALTVLGLIFGRDRKTFRLDANTILLAALLVIGLLSSVNEISASPDGWVLYSRLVKVIVLAFIMTMVIHDRLRIHAAVLTMVVAMGFNGVDEGLKFVASGGYHRVLGLSNVGDNNSFAVAILMLIPMIFYLYKQSAEKLVRISCLVGISLCVISIIATFSRGGFIGLMLLALTFVSGRKNKIWAGSVVAVLAIIVLFVTPDSFFQRVDTIDAVRQDSSFMGRVIAWKMSLLIALDHPLLGGGFHAVQHPDVWAAYKPFFYTLDFIPTQDPGVLPHAAHSIYFEVLGDLGFLGLAVFLGLLAVGLLGAWSVKRRTRGHPEMEWAHELARMLQLSLLVYAVTGAALSMGYFEMFYIMLTVTSVLRRCVREEYGRVRSAVTPPIRAGSISDFPPVGHEVAHAPLTRRNV